MEERISPVLIDIDTIDISEDKNLEHVVANFQKIAFYTCTKNGKPLVNGDLACHGRILGCGGGQVKDMLTNFTGTTEGSDDILKYLFWLKGPFRKLLELETEKPWVIYHKSGTPVAIRVPDEVMAYNPFPLIYAWLVVSRFPSEFKHQTKAFSKLIAAGAEPNAAMLLSRRLMVDDSGSIIVGHLDWNGIHTHINESYNGLDWDMYRKGEHHPGLKQTSYTGTLWARKGRSSLSRFDLNIYSEPTSSLFTKMSFIPEKNLPIMAKDFEKFMNERYMT